MSNPPGPPPDSQETIPRPAPRKPVPTLGDVMWAVLVVWFASTMGVSPLFSTANRRLFSTLELVWASSLVVALAGCVAAWFFVCHRPRRPSREALRLQWSGTRWALGGTALGVVLGFATLWATRLDVPSLVAGQVQGLLGHGLFAAYLLLAPAGEEVFYRGLVLPALVGRFGANAGLAVLTVGHATLLAVFSEHAALFFALAFVVELGLSLLRHFSRSLWPSLIANWTRTATFYVVVLSG